MSPRPIEHGGCGVGRSKRVAVEDYDPDLELSIEHKVDSGVGAQLVPSLAHARPLEETA